MAHTTSALSFLMMSQGACNTLWRALKKTKLHLNTYLTSTESAQFYNAFLHPPLKFHFLTDWQITVIFHLTVFLARRLLCVTTGRLNHWSARIKESASVKNLYTPLFFYQKQWLGREDQFSPHGYGHTTSFQPFQLNHLLFNARTPNMMNTTGTASLLGLPLHCCEFQVNYFFLVLIRLTSAELQLSRRTRDIIWHP